MAEIGKKQHIEMDTQCLPSGDNNTGKHMVGHHIKDIVKTMEGLLGQNDMCLKFLFFMY